MVPHDVRNPTLKQHGGYYVHAHGSIKSTNMMILPADWVMTRSSGRREDANMQVIQATKLKLHKHPDLLQGRERKLKTAKLYVG